GQEIERFRGRLRACLAEARSLLGASEPADSDAWLELGERLQRDCWLLASATHCLHEWAEPDDAHADIDTHDEPPGASTVGLDAATLHRRQTRRAGRRNIRLWREGR
nr:hypothetical protein [Solirubrobacterales bacterium]